MKASLDLVRELMMPASPDFRVALARLSSVLPAAFAVATSLACAETPTQILDRYRQQAVTSPAPSRGQQFFSSAHGHEWSCASCHGSPPTETGRHAATGKSIAPLAPAFNPERFTDPTKTEKWFRRNCNDVVGRECTAAEKADVLSWLLTLSK